MVLAVNEPLMRKTLKLHGIRDEKDIRQILQAAQTYIKMQQGGGVEGQAGVSGGLALPQPPDVSGVVLVGTRTDGIIPPADTGAIARHWGVHPRWIDDGHVSAVLRRPHAMAQAVIDAFA